MLLPVPGAEVLEVVPVEFVLCGDLPLPWQGVTSGSRSINTLGVSLGSHQPCLEMGDTAKGMWWLTGHNCHSHPGGFPGEFLLTDSFPAASKHISFPSPVPGGIASESLTFTPLEDMIFLKWEEPVEPNGLITQYEVCPGCCVTWGNGDTGGAHGGVCWTGLGQPLLSAMGIRGNCCCPRAFGFSSFAFTSRSPWLPPGCSVITPPLNPSL